MPRKKQPDNIPFTDMLDSTSDIIGRAMSDHQDDPWYTYAHSGAMAGAQVRNSSSEDSEMTEDGEAWWT